MRLDSRSGAAIPSRSRCRIIELKMGRLKLLKPASCQAAGLFDRASLVEVMCLNQQPQEITW